MNDFAHFRTGSICLKQIQQDSTSDRRSQPAILVVLHNGPKIMLETEVSLRLTSSVQDPTKRVCINGVDVGEVHGQTWEEAFLTVADRLRRAADSMEAAAKGTHLSLPVSSIHPSLALPAAEPA